MSTNIFRPAGVSTPGLGGGNPSSPGQPQQQQPQQQGRYANDPLAQMRGFIEQSNQQNQGAGGIRWEQYGNSRYEDQALRDLRNESNLDEDSNQFFLQKYSQAAAEFFQSMGIRRGVYYEEYRNTTESFKNTLKFHTACHIRTEFINTLNKHPDMVMVITKAATPMYCQRLIAIAKSKREGEELNRAEYLGAVQFAIRSVLTMEMISWLCKSDQGRSFTYSLTPEIKEFIANLENYKDSFDIACATFGVSNPYGALAYEIQTPTALDTKTIQDTQTAFMYNTFGGNQNAPVQSKADQNSLEAMIQRNAQSYSDEHGITRRAPQPEAHGHGWGNERTDYENMDRDNRDKYDYLKLFRPIGKHNHYLVSETHWKKIKKAFKRHPDQPHQEETVLHGCFRVVIIDLGADDGWFSTVVRGEGLEMSIVWSDPEKLLPILEGVEDTGNVVVKSVSVEEALGKNNKGLEIPVDFCEELKAIPVITVKDKLVATSSMKLHAMFSGTNKTLTKRIKDVNATSFHSTIWETYTCNDADEKNTIVDEYPFLFKDVEDVGEVTFYQRVKRLATTFNNNEITEEFKIYVDERLTNLMNEWLVSSLGYDKDPNSPNHLSISSIITYVDDVLEDFRANDEEALRCFTRPGGPENYLTESMKIFSVDNKYDVLKEDESIIQKAQRQTELTMDRDFHVTVINNKTGPIVGVSNEPVVIKRSKFSDYFDLVEKGFESTMGDDYDIRVTDKIIHFSDSDNLWLFSYTSVDRNVATLRLIGRQRSLLYVYLV